MPCCRYAGLQLHRIEQVLVIVDRAVVDRLNRRFGVAGRLSVVVHLGPGHGRAGTVDEGVVAQIAGKADMDPIELGEQLVLLIGCCVLRSCKNSDR